MSYRFRADQLLVEQETVWPKCGWSNEIGWQGCKRDGKLAQFDEDGNLIFRCTPHIEESDAWPMAELAA